MTARIESALVVFGVLLLVGCKPAASTKPAEAEARVVRLMFQSNERGWKAGVNGKDASQIPVREFTNRVAQLWSHHGDIVLIQTPENAQLSGDASPTVDWLARFCESNRVALYALPSSHGDLFSIPCYHWASPYGNPRDLGKSSFYHDGKFLGTALDGFTNMLDQIEHEKRRAIFLLGSRYDLNGGFGLFEKPFEDREHLLKPILERKRMEILRLSLLP